MYQTYLNVDVRRVAIFAGMAILATAILFATIPVALAAQPNNQACLGEDISGYAQGGADFGGFIANLAKNTNGAGDELQAHLAGLVPDEVIPNTCNNP